MNHILVNPTPVRTSQNYQMNDILMEELNWSEKKEFGNILFDDFDQEHITITNSTDDYNLTYGMGHEMDAITKHHSNVKMKIEVKKDSTKENKLCFLLDENYSQLVEDIEIIVEQGAQGKLTIQYLTDQKQNVEGIHSGTIRTYLKQNAKLQLTIVQKMNLLTHNLLTIENQMEESSRLDCNMIDFGGRHSITNYYTNLQGDYAENTVKGIYLGIKNQILDMNYIAEARGMHTKVNIDVQGALKDTAKKHFKGTIDFKRGGKKAEGSENEFCMLLSDKAHSISLPMLLCDEEDVVGNHATAAGKVNHKELFYLMSRGLSEQEAKILLVKARFYPLLEQMTDEKMREEILAEVDYRLL